MRAAHGLEIATGLESLVAELHAMQTCELEVLPAVLRTPLGEALHLKRFEQLGPIRLSENRMGLNHAGAAERIHDTKYASFFQCLQNDGSRHSILDWGAAIRNLSLRSSATATREVSFVARADYLSAMRTPSSLASIAVFALLLVAHDVTAQAVSADSTVPKAAPVPQRHYKLRFALGFVSSILAHESGHIIASYAVGGHPSFGFNKWRPTIYSGIDASIDPHKQFIFSSAGLTVQTLLDETLLDVPHAKGSIAGPFERGLLAGGLGTVLFYITLGRNGSVSDVSFMSRTSSLSKNQISLIFGGIGLLQAVRIHFKDRYAHFFSVPDDTGRFRIGMSIAPN